MKINSKEYWDNRFESNWIEYGGIAQTTAFMELLIQHLPDEVDLNGKAILDWGCALGQGVEVLSRAYPMSKVSGLDFSSAAIDQCKEQYLNNDFYSGYLVDYMNKYDAILTSNCLEHFEDPFVWLKQITDYSSKYVIVLVPHKDMSYLHTNSEHKYLFTEDTFKDTFNGFKKTYQKVIEHCPNCWAGEQLLLVYEKE